VRPLGPALLAAAVVAAAVAWQDPVALAAAAAAGLVLLAAAPPPRRFLLVFAIAAALPMVLLNPLAAVHGLTPLAQGPDLPVIDTEITLEEVVFGAGAALRVLASALAVAAFVRLADGDLVLRAVARVAPRSALLVAVASRLLPTLERDAAGIAWASRTRGASPTGTRAAGDLVAPLLATSLERSLALAEAMEARGYGSGPRTRPPAPRALPVDRALAAFGAVAAALVAASIAGGWTAFRYYETLGDPAGPAALGAAGSLFAIAAAAAGAVRWMR